MMFPYFTPQGRPRRSGRSGFNPTAFFEGAFEGGAMAGSGASVSTDSLFSIETTTLSQGIPVYFKRMSGAPRIAFGLYVFGGNRIEDQPGYADMIDDLLVEGTQQHSAEAISLLLDSLSLSLDVDTRRDYSVMSGTLLEEDLDASFALIGDLLFQSNFTSFEKEKVRIQGELMMELDSPSTQAYDAMMEALLKDTPYQSSLSNILKHLPEYTSVDPLLEHYNQVYQPANMLISVVGDCDLETIVQCFEKHLCCPSGKGTQSFMEAKAIKSATIKAPQLVTIEKNDSNQLHLFRGWMAPALSHPDYPVVTLINNILGGKGLTSRLFLEIRDKQGLAYHVRSQYEASKYLGVFGMYIGTEPSNRQKVMDGFDRECQKLMEALVSDQELADSKENLLGKKIVYLETAAQQSIYLGAQLSMGMSISAINDLNDKIRSVSAHDIQRVAQHLFGQPQINALVGPASCF